MLPLLGLLLACIALVSGFRAHATVHTLVFRLLGVNAQRAKTGLPPRYRESNHLFHAWPQTVLIPLEVALDLLVVLHFVEAGLLHLIWELMSKVRHQVWHR